MTPGRIVPSSGGVESDPSSKTKKMFMPPSSSTQRRSTASRKTTWSQPLRIASAWATQAGGIIAAAFGLAGAARRGADIFARHPERDARRALEVGADRRGDDRVDDTASTASCRGTTSFAIMKGRR